MYISLNISLYQFFYDIQQGLPLGNNDITCIIYS